MKCADPVRPRRRALAPRACCRVRERGGEHCQGSANATSTGCTYAKNAWHDPQIPSPAAGYKTGSTAHPTQAWLGGFPQMPTDSRTCRRIHQEAQHGHDMLVARVVPLAPRRLARRPPAAGHVVRIQRGGFLRCSVGGHGAGAGRVSSAGPLCLYTGAMGQPRRLAAAHCRALTARSGIPVRVQLPPAHPGLPHSIQPTRSGTSAAAS